MNSDSGYFKLGLFVITGVALMVGGVILFGAGALFTQYATVETAIRGSVEGLDVGGAVKYAGLKIGKVSAIDMAMWRYRDVDPAKRLEVQKYVIVEMQIRRDMLVANTSAELQNNLEIAVKNGLRARLASSGFTGPAFMEILFVDPATHPVEAPPWTPRDMYVPGTPSEMTEIVNSIQSTLAQVNKANIPQTVGDLRKLINDTDVAVNDLRMKELREKAQVILDNLNRTLSAAAPAATEMGGLLRRVSLIVASQNQDLEAIILNLRHITEQGALLMEDAKNNPSRMLFGEPPPHFNGASK
jgi:phospholipid/cholesterol/gamma-HCH transport system substrate-binding protein